jgi:hypothetical protein
MNRKEVKMSAKEALKWVNTKKIINPKAKKPCHKLGYCPYGQIVELYPLRVKRSKYSCKVFGHDCPVFYTSEKLAE